jgi:hypothetical protein
VRGVLSAPCAQGTAVVCRGCLHRRPTFSATRRSDHYAGTTPTLVHRSRRATRSRSATWTIQKRCPHDHLFTGTRATVSAQQRASRLGGGGKRDGQGTDEAQHCCDPNFTSHSLPWVSFQRLEQCKIALLAHYGSSPRPGWRSAVLQSSCPRIASRPRVWTLETDQTGYTVSEVGRCLQRITRKLNIFMPAAQL